jgi:hypothetical protein
MPCSKHWTQAPVERYRFIISDGDSFEQAIDAAYVNPVAAEAHAAQITKELSEDGTWHGGWILVIDMRGNEVARVPISSEGMLSE